MIIESLLIAAQNNAIRTNHIKARIDKTQQNNICRLCGDRDEMITHIISKCSKLAQNEYKTRHEWVGKGIHLELCKKFKFEPMNKWYMHNSESVLENKIHKLLWDFEIQTDYLISARWPDLIIIKKRKWTCKIVDFADPTDHRVKLKESIKKDKYLGFARELRKLWNMKLMVIPVVICAPGTVAKGLVRTGGLVNVRMSGDHSNHSIIEIDQNLEKSPSNLRRFAVTQTPVGNHWLTLVGKSKKRANNDNNNNNLTIWTSSICTTQQLSWRMTHTNSYWTLTFKRIT